MLRITLLMAALHAWALSPATASAQGDTTTTGGSRAFNPAISLNALFLGHYLDAEEVTDPDPAHEHEHGLDEGFSVQEVELRFTADVDAYARADATLAFHDDEVEFEEIYADILTLPAGLGLRAGKMYAPVSRENTTHTHNLPFVQRSLGQEELFDEGWGAAGAQLSWLPPMPVYSELRLAALDASDSDWFGAESDGGIATVAQLATLFELGESTTFGILGSGAWGENDLQDHSAAASAGVDFRWKPARKTIYRGFRLNAEYLWAERQGTFDDTLRDPGGLDALTTWAQLQFARRWWVSARYDWLDSADEDTQTRWSASLSFVPTEFQALRLEFSSTDDGADRSNSVYLQYNVTIGSHPAHLY